MVFNHLLNGLDPLEQEVQILKHFFRTHLAHEADFLEDYAKVLFLAFSIVNFAHFVQNHFFFLALHYVSRFLISDIEAFIGISVLLGALLVHFDKVLHVEFHKDIAGHVWVLDLILVVLLLSESLHLQIDFIISRHLQAIVPFDVHLPDLLDGELARLSQLLLHLPGLALALHPAAHVDTVEEPHPALGLYLQIQLIGAAIFSRLRLLCFSVVFLSFIQRLGLVS